MEIKVDRKAAVKKLRSLVLYPKSGIEAFRSKLEKNFNTVFLPNRVENIEKIYGNVKCDYLVPEVYVSHRIMLYVHGGSFVGGSRESWRSFCASLANACMSKLVLPDFRLPPSHSFPAGLEDVQTVFRMMKAEEELLIQKSLSSKSADSKSALKNATSSRENFADSNSSSDNSLSEVSQPQISSSEVSSSENPLPKNSSHVTPEIILVADSSGASILMALMFSLSEDFRKSVSKIILFSPWLNLGTDDSVISNKKKHDSVISSEALRFAADLYTYSSNIKNPLISPLNAKVQDFNCFPEFYIQNGEDEILLEQTYNFKKLLDEANVKNTIDVYPKMMYMFQMADEFLPESHLAIENLAKWINFKPREVQESPYKASVKGPYVFS